MNESKRKKLEAAGFKVGSAADFLGDHMTIEQTPLEVAARLRSDMDYPCTGPEGDEIAAIIESQASRIAALTAALRDHAIKRERDSMECWECSSCWVRNEPESHAQDCLLAGSAP